MGFDNDHPNRKDRRKQYPKKAQRCDRTCRPGGDCPWCQGNRKHSETKRKMAVDPFENADLMLTTAGDWRRITLGCPKHPSYRGKASPRSACPECHDIFRIVRAMADGINITLEVGRE